MFLCVFCLCLLALFKERAVFMGRTRQAVRYAKADTDFFDCKTQAEGLRRGQKAVDSSCKASQDWLANSGEGARRDLCACFLYD